MRQLLPDWFTMALVGMVILATIIPCYGMGADILKLLTTVAIGLLFFLYGSACRRRRARRHQALAAARLVSAATFVLFPLLGWAEGAGAGVISPEL